MADNEVQEPWFLGIVGSPRRGGNTEVLVEEILAGAAETGARTDKVFLADLDVRPCRGCDGCHKLGHCVQKDDMAGLLEKMARSPVWVLGTPVYWWGPTAQFKAFVDRWYGAGRQLKFRGRRAILAVPLGDSDAAVARHTVGMLTDALNYVGIEIAATLVGPNLMNVGDVRGHADLLLPARRAGREAAEQLTSGR